MLTAATVAAALLWMTLLVLPWRPWSTRERLDIAIASARRDFTDVTVLVPARDEASCIVTTLRAIAAQGRLARIIVVDDQSSDGTGALARSLALDNLLVMDGTPPPPDWSGKLWALNQGARHVETPCLLLLDADIELAPGALNALTTRMTAERLDLVSVMAHLHMATRWEKLLLPPFVYFFKLIYPFALSNAPHSRIAAAAGGCILLKTEALRAIGGFEALHDALIDDCTLAQRVKRNGGRTWLGLAHGVRAVRPANTLGNIWNMVARTAFTQLRYSGLLLAVCSALLLLSFVVPLLGLVSGDRVAVIAAAVALAAMGSSYLPTIRYYGLHPLRIVSLPVAACLFLAMTWTSAARYWSGERSRWKSRSYGKAAGG